MYENDCIKIMENRRGSGWSYLLPERIFYWQTVRIGADHLDIIRDWANLRLDFRYCQDWFMCGLFPFLRYGPSKNSNCKSRNRTTKKQTIESSTQLLALLVHTVQLLYPYPKQPTSWKMSQEETKCRVCLPPFSSESWLLKSWLTQKLHNASKLIFFTSFSSSSQQKPQSDTSCSITGRNGGSDKYMYFVKQGEFVGGSQ